MKQLRATDPTDNAVLWGECVLCHVHWRLDQNLAVVGHNHGGRRCRGSGRAPRHRTITNKLAV